MSEIKTIGILTSGGDAPGMNACIRALVRTAKHYGVRTYGISHGYQGLINNDISELEARDVSYVIDRGGTFLFSARCKEFYEKEGRKKAAEQMAAYEMDALVVIGGDGSFKGAQKLSEEHGIKVIGIPGTIDNDIAGTDVTLGYDTASNTAMEAIDKIRDTATSHNRLFLVEVMGRDAGDIALRCGLATGALGILIPERDNDLEPIFKSLTRARNRRKRSNIIVVAEGDESGGAMEIAKKINKRFPEYETRVTILGHIQRGGSPTVFDRELASRMGVLAVEALKNGKSNLMVAHVKGEMKLVPLHKAVQERPVLNPESLRMAEILSY